MRNGGLRQFYSLLNIRGAKSSFFIKRAPAFFFESQKNPAAGGIGDSMQKAIEIGSDLSHDEEG